MNQKRIRGAVMMAAAALVGSSLESRAASETWTNPAGGSWPVGSNWLSNNPADGVDSVADFSRLNLSANAIVTLDGARTLGGLTFADFTPSNDWTLNAGTGDPLTLALSSGIPTLNVINRTATVNTALDGTAGLNKTGTGTLILGGTNIYTGGTTVSAGTLQITAPANLSGATSIASGATVNLVTSATNATLANAFTGSGTLKLTLGGAPANGAFATGIVGFNGTVQVSSTSTTANKFAINVATTAAGTRVVVDTNNTLFISTAASTIHSLSLQGTGNTEGRGSLRIANALTATNGTTLLTSTTIGVEAGTLNGNIYGTATTGNTQNLTIGGTGSTTGTFNGAIVDGGGGGAVALNAVTAGFVALTGPNSYSGGTTVSQNTRVQIGANSLAFGTGTVSVSGDGIVNDGQVFASGTATINNNFTISGLGGNVTDGVQRGAIRLDNGATVNGNVTLSGNAGIGGNAGVGTINGVISGGFNLTVVGGATLNLTAANTYSGNTTIGNAAGNGTLGLTGAGTLGSGSYAGTIAFNNAASTLNVASTANQTFSGAMTGAGSLIKRNTGTLTLSGTAKAYTGGTTIAGGTLTLAFGATTADMIAPASAVTMGGGTLEMTGTGTQAVTAMSTTAATGSRIVLGANETLTITTLTPGAGSGLNVNTGAGGANGAALGTGLVAVTNAVVLPKTFTVTDAGGFGLATFSGTNIVRDTSTALLPDSGGASPTDYRVDNNAGGSAAAGSSTLAVTASQSAGSVTVDTTTAAGTLTLNDGVLLGNNVWNFGGNGSNGYQVAVAAGAVNPTGLQSVAPGEALTFHNANAAPVTIAAPILANGTNAVTFNGTGTTVLTGANTYTGVTTVGSGTLQVGNGGTSGTLGTGTITLTSTSSTLVFNRSDALSVPAANLISGAGSVVKIGPGTTSMAGAHTYSGGTVVNAGTLALGAFTTSGTGVIRGTVTVNAGGTLSTTANDAIGFNAGLQVDTLNLVGGTFNNAATGNQGFRTNVFMTGGSITSTGGGGFNFTNGFGITSNASSTTSTVSAVVIRDTNNMPINVAAGTTPSGFDLTISGVISGATGGITKGGPGTLRLTAANTFGGGTTVAQGTLVADGTNSGTGSLGGGNVTVNSGATIRIGTTNNGFVGSSTTAPRIVQINPGGLVVNPGTTTNHLGPLVMNGGTLSVTGGPNASFGNWNFDQGVSTLGAAAPTVSNISGGNATLSQPGGTIFNVQGSDTLNVSTVLAQIGTTTALVKNGAGTLNLTAANAYTAGTTINSGTLLANNTTGSATGTAAVTVAAGTLGGSGAITGAVTITDTLAPGNSIESLKTGALTFNAGSAYAYELSDTTATGADLASSSGALSIAPGATLAMSDLKATDWAPGNKLTLISYPGAWDGGTFTLAATNGGAALPDDAIFTDALTGRVWSINYNDATGGANFSADVTGGSTFVTLTAVPEPASLSVIALAAAGLLSGRSRRRRQHGAA